VVPVPSEEPVRYRNILLDIPIAMVTLGKVRMCTVKVTRRRIRKHMGVMHVEVMGILISNVGRER
jgi:hypothetical protein